MKIPFLMAPPDEPVKRSHGAVLKVGEDDLIFSEQIKAMRAKVE